MPHDAKQPAATSAVPTKYIETRLKEEWEKKTNDLIKRELEIFENLSKHEQLMITGALKIIENKKSIFLIALFKYATSSAEEELVKLYNINSYSFESHGTSWKIMSWNKRIQQKFKKGIGSQLTSNLRAWLDRTRENKALIK